MRCARRGARATTSSRRWRRTSRSSRTTSAAVSTRSRSSTTATSTRSPPPWSTKSSRSWSTEAGEISRGAVPAMVLYGYHPVREALRHQTHQVARVLVSAARKGARRQEIEDLCRRHGVPLAVVTEKALAAVAGPAHNGMAAEMRQGDAVGEAAATSGAAAARGAAAAARGAAAAGAAAAVGSAASVAALAAPEVRGAADPDLVVLLEDVQDPRNLGAVLRVCEGAGGGQVLIRDRGSAPITPAVAKTAAGASEWLPIERITNSAATLEALKKDGFWAYGSG